MNKLTKIRNDFKNNRQRLEQTENKKTIEKIQKENAKFYKQFDEQKDKYIKFCVKKEKDVTDSERSLRMK